MAKKKITKEEIPPRKREEAEVWGKLKNIQEAYLQEFADRMEADKKEALDSYQTKIAGLKNSKTSMLKEFNVEIKSLEPLDEGQAEIASLKKDKAKMLKEYNVEIKKLDTLVKKMTKAATPTAPKKTTRKTTKRKKKTE